MDIIYFATGNAGKLKSAKDHLEKEGFKIEGKNLNLIEHQTISMEEIAISKAKQAYEQIKKPVIVQDGGFCIPGMNDMPGAYTKDFLHKLKIKGFMMLINAFDPIERKAYFKSVLAFHDEKGHQIFTDEYWGNIIESNATTISHKMEWSPLWQIFIPRGKQKTLSELKNSENYTSIDTAFNGPSVWQQLAISLKEK